MGGIMKKKVLFVLFAILMMAVMTVSVSADQDGYDRYCNSDQYGCWVTGDEGQQIYIMFWSEEAREFFMGPGSNAVVTDPVPGGQMSLGKDPAAYVKAPAAAGKFSKEEMINAYAESVWKNGAYTGYTSIDQLKKAMEDFYTENPQNLERDYKAHVARYEEQSQPQEYEMYDADGNKVFGTDSAEEYVKYMNQEGFVDENGDLEVYVVDENGKPAREPEPTLQRTDANEKTIAEMKEFLVENVREDQKEEFSKWLETASDARVEYNYKYLKVGN